MWKGRCFQCLQVLISEVLLIWNKTVYPSTSALNISQHCMLFGLLTCINKMSPVWFSFINILWRWHVVGSRKVFLFNWRTCPYLQTTQSREGSFTRSASSWCAITGTLGKLEWTLQIVHIHAHFRRVFCFLLLTICLHLRPTNFSAMKMAWGVYFLMRG